MKKGLLITGIVIILAAVAFYISSIQKPQSNEVTDTSEVTKNETPKEDKTYTGVLPCADCSGIDITLVIKPDNTYSLQSVYQGKNDDDPFEITGTWNIESGIPSDENATYYVLAEESGNAEYYLIKDEKTLVQLDQEKNLIDSPFDTILILQKN